MALATSSINLSRHFVISERAVRCREFSYTHRFRFSARFLTGLPLPFRVSPCISSSPCANFATPTRGGRSRPGGADSPVGSGYSFSLFHPSHHQGLPALCCRGVCFGRQAKVRQSEHGAGGGKEDPGVPPWFSRLMEWLVPAPMITSLVFPSRRCQVDDCAGLNRLLQTMHVLLLQNVGGGRRGFPRRPAPAYH